jgi:hypothetical protein
VTNTAKPFTLTKDSFAFPQLNDLGESVELPEINMGHAGPRLCSPKAFRTPETVLARPFNEKSTSGWSAGLPALHQYQFEVSHSGTHGCALTHSLNKAVGTSRSSQTALLGFASGLDNRDPGQVMRPYSPDSGLNILGFNNSLDPGSECPLRFCRHRGSISSMFLILVRVACTRGQSKAVRTTHSAAVICQAPYSAPTNDQPDRPGVYYHRHDHGLRRMRHHWHSQAEAASKEASHQYQFDVS